MPSPVIIFAFNRLDTLKACVESLMRNELFTESDLIVYVDGPRANKEGEAERVEAVRQYVQSISGSKSLVWHFSDYNKGLAASIIDGVTEVINQYEKAIVVEDDLYLSPSFLTYMNTMLEAYKNDSRIMQVTGYSAKIRHSERFHCDHYLTRRAHSWSWGTWKDRWETVDWEVKDYDELAASKEKQKAFNEYGSDLFGMLKGWKTGVNNSWYIRFDYAMHKQGRFSIAPICSLVRNDGFGSEATNCKSYNRYIVDFQNIYKEEWDLPKYIEWNKKLDKESVRYWSIPYRIYGKIRTKLSLR